MILSQLLRGEQELLLARLEYVKTNYHQDSRCMDSTREFLPKQLVDWATKEPGQREESNTYSIYGLPGFGKTSLAHSIFVKIQSP